MEPKSMIRSVPRLASCSTGHHSAIIGANSVEQLQQNPAALNVTLTAAQLAQLDEVSNWQEA
jgi:aryl-alcohol dehydrogenase-like predicted oxidoreductase